MSSTSTPTAKPATDKVDEMQLGIDDLPVAGKPATNDTMHLANTLVTAMTQPENPLAAKLLEFLGGLSSSPPATTPAAAKGKAKAGLKRGRSEMGDDDLELHRAKRSSMRGSSDQQPEYEPRLQYLSLSDDDDEMLEPSSSQSESSSSAGSSAGSSATSVASSSSSKGAKLAAQWNGGGLMASIHAPGNRNSRDGSRNPKRENHHASAWLPSMAGGTYNPPSSRHRTSSFNLARDQYDEIVIPRPSADTEMDFGRYVGTPIRQCSSAHLKILLNQAATAHRHPETHNAVQEEFQYRIVREFVTWYQKQAAKGLANNYKVQLDKGLIYSFSTS